MLAKLTSKNQISIPRKIIDQIPEARCFKIEWRDGAVLLRPLRTCSTSLKAIRSKVRNLDLGPLCVKEAIKWARSK